MNTESLLAAIKYLEVLNAKNLYKFERVAFHTNEVTTNSIFAAITVKKDYPNATRFFSVDKRRPGDYYFEYHQYIPLAIEKGAKAIICEHFPSTVLDHIIYIKVKNVIDAYKELTHYLIEKFNIKIICITGSSGKTSTVHCVYEVLRILNDNTRKVYTYRSTPITLPDKVINTILGNELKNGGNLILEIPTDHPGCISNLTAICNPHIAVILNILNAHINIFGSRDEIAKGKFEIFEHLNPGGIAVLNIDNDKIKEYRYLTDSISNRLTFGLDKAADITGEIIEVGEYTTKYKIIYKNESAVIEPQLIGISGLHMVLTTVSICLSLGHSLDEISLAFEKYRPLEGRMSWTSLSANRLLIFDNSEKTNPVNLQHVLSEVVQLPWNGYRILALGVYRRTDEHQDVSEDFWSSVCDFFDEILLIGNDAYKYEQDILQMKTDITISNHSSINSVLHYVYRKFHHLPENKFYLTVIGYASDEQTEVTKPLSDLVIKLRNLIK